MKWNFEGTSPTLVLYPETEMERQQMAILKTELMTDSEPRIAAIFTKAAPDIESCQILCGPKNALIDYLLELRGAIHPGSVGDIGGSGRQPR